VRADLAEEIPAGTFTGASVVVHAAAETAGGFLAHERNTVGATHRVLPPLDSRRADGPRRPAAFDAARARSGAPSRCEPNGRGT
jgi:hypothetical protein